MCDFLFGLLTLGTNEHFFESEHTLELHKDTVFFLKFIRVSINSGVEQQSLFDLLGLITKFDSKLIVVAHLLPLTALEDLIMHFEAFAEFVSVVRHFIPLAALRAHADVVSDDTQEDRCGAGLAEALLAVEPPAAHLPEERHVVGQLALLGVHDLGHAFLLFEEVEGPVVAALGVERGSVGDFDFVREQVFFGGRRRGCGCRAAVVICCGEVGDRGIDVLGRVGFLSGVVGAGGHAVEVEVLEHPVGVDVASEFGVGAHVDVVAHGAFILELDAALGFCLRLNQRRRLRRRVVFEEHSAVVLYLSLLDD